MSEDHELIPSQRSITEIQAIRKSRGTMIRSRQDIPEFVELPLVQACEKLWDLNVQTLSSSANIKDIGGLAYIIVDYDSLSEDNKKTALKCGEFLEDYDDIKAVKLTIPIVETSKVSEIPERFLEEVNKFKKQKAKWIPSYTLRELREIYGIDPEDETYGVNSFVDEGLYYDKTSNRFYLSEEHFIKANEEVDEETQV